MSVNNTGVRADIPKPPSSQPGSGAGGGTSFVPSTAPNNPSKDNKGDPLGNATVSLLHYMFEVLPGRVTGALTPVASEAQSRTPQLMASVHAQDAVAANQSSWDSGFWVSAGGALSMGFDGLSSLTESRARPAVAADTPTVKPRALLRDLEASLSVNYKIEKSRGQLRHERKGGDGIAGLTVLLPERAHSDELERSRRRSVVSEYFRPDRGDKVLLELVGWEKASREGRQAACDVDLEYCEFFTEPASINGWVEAFVEARDVLVETLVWMNTHLSPADSQQVSEAAKDIDLGHTNALQSLRGLLEQYVVRLPPDQAAEISRKNEAIRKGIKAYLEKVTSTSLERSKQYLLQGEALRARMPKEAVLFQISGSGHVDDVKVVVLNDVKHRYLLGNYSHHKA